MYLMTKFLHNILLIFIHTRFVFHDGKEHCGKAGKGKLTFPFIGFRTFSKFLCKITPTATLEFGAQAHQILQSKSAKVILKKSLKLIFTLFGFRRTIISQFYVFRNIYNETAEL